MHRTWMTDRACQEHHYKEEPNHFRGRWSKSMKEEYYRDRDSKLYSLRPHDEMFGTWSNRRVWTHLLDSGAKPGGTSMELKVGKYAGAQHSIGSEKLMLVPPRQTGLHLKGGLYKGKFENVEHKQLIVNTGAQDQN